VRICRQLEQSAGKGSSQQVPPFEFLDPCFGPTIAADGTASSMFLCPRMLGGAVVVSSADRNAPVVEQYLEWLSAHGASVPPGKPLTPDGVSCLYASGAVPGPAYPKPADLAWKRLMTDKGKPPKLWVDGATSSDPKQGQIGDCWLISALSLLATRDGRQTWLEFSL
jgi:Calpain family cysteine protease